MNFEYTDPQTPMEWLFGGHCSINALGRIEPGDGERFATFLQRTAPPPITCVYLSTSGGSVHDGLQIGGLIRHFGLSTSVGSYLLQPPQEDDIMRRREFRSGLCASSGTLAFLGGRFRDCQNGSEFRVHRFFFQGSTDEVLGPAQQTSAAIARHLADMGIDLRSMQISADLHHAETRSLTVSELAELGPCNAWHERSRVDHRVAQRQHPRASAARHDLWLTEADPRLHQANGGLRPRRS